MDRLKDGDYVITAWSEQAAGPGWTNSPVYILVRERGGALRIECIQEPQQSAEMLTIRPFSHTAHLCMRQAVIAALHHDGEKQK